MRIEKPALKKSLIAIVFASGMLNSSIPALSNNAPVLPDSVVRDIAGNAAYDAQTRAYYLLRLASRFADGADCTAAANQFSFLTEGSGKYDGWEIGLERWARQICYATHEADSSGGKFLLPYTPAENIPLALSSIREAIKLLDSASDEFVKLNLYFVASGLFRRLGEKSEAEKCDKILETAIRACEQEQKSGKDEIRAVASILNVMAYGFISVQVSDVNPADRFVGSPVSHSVNLWAPPVEPEIYTDSDFTKSEKLKLRALAVVDRLSSTNFLRLKAHRDMALWYLQLNKLTAANKEKEILFEMIGKHDDRMLYPNPVGCGQVKWWTVPQYNMGCGLG